MRENVQKLLVMGFGIIIMVFMIVTTQAQSVPVDKDSDYRIQSKDDYVKAERMVDVLAEELYTIHQSYPELTVQHHFNTQNEVVNITVEGVDDPAIANQAAVCYFRLEKLAIAVRDADPAFLPQRAEVRETEVMNEKQSQEYIPPKDSKVDN